MLSLRFVRENEYVHKRIIIINKLSTSLLQVSKLVLSYSYLPHRLAPQLLAPQFLGGAVSLKGETSAETQFESTTPQSAATVHNSGD